MEVAAAAKSHKKLFIIIGAVILLLIIIGNLGGSGSKTSTSTSAGSTVVSQTSTTVSALAQWASVNGQSFDVLSSDLVNISAQVKSDQQTGDYTTASEACSKLASDTKALQSLAPIPDPSYEQLLSQILSNLEQGANSCVSGITNTDTNEINQATTLFNSATTEMETLTNELKAA